MTSFTLRAPAKLNLFLAVSPAVARGRHMLSSVFATIDLSDYLTFTYDHSGERKVTLEVISGPGLEPLNLPTEQNIVYKAVSALEQVCGRRLEGHLDILLEKSIPSEAGLAGGSSDAATTCIALADIWGINPFNSMVIEAAASLGADVPYFLYGGCALMGGDGGKMLRRLAQPALDLVLVKPQAGVSTAAAYAAFDANPQPAPSPQALVDLLMAGGATSAQVAENLSNNLTPAACTLLPELEQLIQQVAAQPGVYKALMTGSGSTVFAICESPQTATRIATHFQQKGHWSTPATTV